MKVRCNKKYKALQLSINTPKANYITYFTPTFNRSYLLPQLYENLKSQTNCCFVWLVVNDGSVDHTDSVMETFLVKDEFPICFISKENGGKHSAFEFALHFCGTEFFVNMDDDDSYLSEATEYYLNEWEQLKLRKDYDSIGAIRTLVKNSQGQYITHQPDRLSNIFFKGSFVKTTLDIQYRMKIHMENWTCYKTGCLRSIDLFPKNYWLRELHTFYSEGIWQARFAKKYTCWYTDKVLRIYSTEEATSLSRPQKSRSFYINWFINLKLTMDERYDYAVLCPIEFLHDVAWISILNHLLGYSYKDLYTHTKSKFLRFAYLMVYPLAFIVKRNVNQK